MALSSLFKRKTSGDADGGSSATAAPVDGVQKIRIRTRQRLIGAVVLVTVGVIGFPLLFESQPRPIPVDIPIEIPSQDNAPVLALPAARSEPHAAASAVMHEASPASAPAPMATASVAASSVVLPSVTAVSPAASAISPQPVLTPAAKSAGTVVPANESRAASSASDRASEIATSTVPRFVVQVGAFADPASARGVRIKLEKLGLKTYAQTAETKDGKRIRVRLGPFVSRAEADKAAARARDAGVASVVLTL